MRRALPLLVLSISLFGLFLFWLSTFRSGPTETGPFDARVQVNEVPNPATDPPPDSSVANGGDPSSDQPEDQDLWALPQGFRQLLQRDAIEPIYNPTFTTAEDSTWPDDALVIGVALNGEARAYPVGPLNRREMVIDEIGGEPVLVTW